MKEATMKELAERYGNQIDEPFQDIYKRLGFDALRFIVEEFGGTYLYIPKDTTVFKNCIFACIKDEYNGVNRKKLATKYGVSEYTVRNIVG